MASPTNKAVVSLRLRGIASLFRAVRAHAVVTTKVTTILYWPFYYEYRGGLMVPRQGGDVALEDSVASQLPDQPARVRARDLEDGEAADVARMASCIVRERSSSLARLWVARTKEAPNLPSSEGIDCISTTTTSAPRRRSEGRPPCSRITASTRLSRDAPIRAATSRPTVPCAVARKVAEWARELGKGLGGLNSEERREILLLLIDRVIIDRHDSVSISLAIPTRELVAIDSPTTSCWLGNSDENLGTHGLLT